MNNKLNLVRQKVSYKCLLHKRQRKHSNNNPLEKKWLPLSKDRYRCIHLHKVARDLDQYAFQLKNNLHEWMNNSLLLLEWNLKKLNENQITKIHKSINMHLDLKCEKHLRAQNYFLGEFEGHLKDIKKDIIFSLKKNELYSYKRCCAEIYDKRWSWHTSSSSTFIQVTWLSKWRNSPLQNYCLWWYSLCQRNVRYIFYIFIFFFKLYFYISLNWNTTIECITMLTQFYFSSFPLFCLLSSFLR